MDDLSKEHVISTYNKSLAMFGDRPEAVYWTEKGQRVRFESLLKLTGSIEGRKILDYGCGKGDFYQFLKARGIKVTYTGFDINEKLLTLAKKKFPEGNFRIFNIYEDKLDESFDYIYLCGVFNLKIPGLADSAMNAIKDLFNSCRIALVFNALSGYEKKKDYTLQYFDPSEVIDFAIKNLSPYTEMVHRKDPYDFTLSIHKVPPS